MLELEEEELLDDDEQVDEEGDPGAATAEAESPAACWGRRTGWVEDEEAVAAAVADCGSFGVFSASEEAGHSKWTQWNT